MPREQTEVLADTSFCRSLPRKVVEQLADMSEEVLLPAHSCLFEEGEDHPSVYLVLRGTILLDIFVQGRGHIELLTLSEGEFLGWSPLITAGPMSVRARTTTEAVVARFSARQVRELCEQDHFFGYHFMKQVAVAFVKRLMATRIQMLDLFAPPDGNAGNSPSSGKDGSSS